LPLPEPDVLIDHDGDIAIITLNRPDKLNPISTDMNTLIQERLRAWAEDARVRCIVMTGAGRGFCSGADLTSFGPEMERPAWSPPRPETRTPNVMQDSAKPIVVAVNGPAIGGGMGIALAGDIRIASDRATFGAFQAKRGIPTDFGTSWFLPRILGTQKALELAWLGEQIDAQEALRLGLVLKVVPHETLMEEALALARRIAAGPPVAIQIIKRLMYRSMSEALWTVSEWESWGVQKCMTTEDFVEASRAFREKRAPVFHGR
jgi:2-(1,2-epoxy-1,2-dihydrophenyl)acetyl-CoA isomerase